MKHEPTEEDAILNALGALTEEERLEFEQQMANASPELESLSGEYQNLAALIGSHGPQEAIPAEGLKEAILKKAFESTVESEGFTFIGTQDVHDWQPLPVPGAFVKLLSMDQERGYAVVLGKLDPGTRYPAHTHIHGEEIYMLTGDLHIGERRMEAGDFHHAAAGTRHDVNWSETGCTLMAVISLEDLQAQFAAAGASPSA